MNTLVVTLDFKPNPGGIAEFTHQLAHHWQMGGDNVMVLSQTIDPKGDAQFDSGCSYRVKRFDYPSPSLGKVRRARTVYSVLMDAIRGHSPDVILNNTAGDLSSFCWLASHVAHVPFCVLAHGRDVNRRIPWTWSVKQRVMLRGAAGVFCNSSYTASAARRRGAAPESTTVVNPGFSSPLSETPSDGSTVSAKRELGLTGRKVILTVGRLVERKGNDKIIEALPTIRKQIPEVLYVIVGEGPYRAALEKKVKELGLEQHVRFDGYVDVLDRTKPSYYDAADVFAMLSRAMGDGDVEGFGMVFLEAGAHGKPVVGGRSGGIVDAIDHGKSGFLVNPVDVGEIGAALLQLLQDEQLAKRMGKWGRERVLTEFSWEVVASRMRERLVAIVERNARRKETR